MSFDRLLLPDPLDYFASRGLSLRGGAGSKWRTTRCVFHGGSDSMRINAALGCWVCMNCGEKGGDVLAYEIKSTGQSFTDAAKALGSWVETGPPRHQKKSTSLSPRMALSVLNFEATLVAVAAANVASGVSLSGTDRDRLIVAKNRIERLAEAFE